jgi:hypothetical protein
MCAYIYIGRPFKTNKIVRFNRTSLHFCAIAVLTLYVQLQPRSWGNSVSIVRGYRLDDRATMVRSSSLCVQTSSEAHPVSYPMSSGGPFPGSKARPGRDADHSPHLVPRSRMSSPLVACMAVPRQLYLTPTILAGWPPYSLVCGSCYCILVLQPPVLVAFTGPGLLTAWQIAVQQSVITSSKLLFSF